MFLCFSQPRGIYQGFFNSLVAFFTRGNYCHVVVVFELPQRDGKIKYQECSIIKCNDEHYNKVYLSEVENLQGWTCYRLQLEKPEYEIEAYNYVCTNLLGKKYDDIGSIMDFTFFSCFPKGYESIVHQNGEKTYCSKLALEILQRSGQFLDQNPYKISPNGLYKLVQKSNDKAGKWTDVSTYASDIFSKKYNTAPISYVYTNTKDYQGLLTF